VADIAKLEDAERRLAGLAREAGLPEPDEVNYREEDEEVEFVWREQKLVVVVDCAPIGPAAG
jgi:hypothetical protein